MPTTTTSPNMSLPIPVVGSDPGPTYGTDVNTCLTLIDQHDHTSGSGVQITPNGLNINSDLSIGGNNLTTIRSVRLSSQSAALSGASDLGCLYEVGVDLYYNDGSGNQIRITQSGGVVGSPGTISSLTSPASATYVSANSTFVWQSDANTSANLDCGSVILRNLTASSKGLTLNPPASMGANFSITLPSLPGSTKLVSIDASGNMGATLYVDNSTIDISSNLIEVKAGGITSTQLASSSVTTAKIADANVTTAKIASQAVTTALIADANVTNAKLATDAVATSNIQDGAVTQAKRAALGQQISNSSSTFSGTATTETDVNNLTVTITTTGRLVYLQLLNDGSGSPGRIGFEETGSRQITVDITFVRDGTTEVGRHQILNDGAAGSDTGHFLMIPASSFAAVDLPSAGSHTYKCQYKVTSGATAFVQFTKLLAYEL